jgi:hypothetical protein
MKKLLLVGAILLAASVALAQANPSGQGNSDLNGGLQESWSGVVAGAGPNNLGGPGLGRHDLKTTAGQPLGCESCHLPHTATTYGASFLWAWTTVPTVVATYSTETNLGGALTSPTGRSGNDRSMLCLSCHDGTSVAANNIIASNTANGLPYALINTGGGLNPDLSTQHPVDAIVPATADYAQPTQLTVLGTAAAVAVIGTDSLPLWSSNSIASVGAAGRVECTTCHDPHNDYTSDQGVNGGAPFLRVANTNGVVLCRECHNQ